MGRTEKHDLDLQESFKTPEAGYISSNNDLIKYV